MGKRYRFKTEKEFKKEFGERWRLVVKNTWNLRMDKYLGKEIIEPSLTSARLDLFFSFGGWHFSTDMYTVQSNKIEMANGASITYNGLHEE